MIRRYSSGVSPQARGLRSYFLIPIIRQLMQQPYSRTDQERRELLARTAWERSQPRHQATLKRLRLLASIF